MPLNPEKHEQLLSKVNAVSKHGTMTGYYNRCRCDKCREASRKYQIGWRKKNPGYKAKKNREYREAGRDKQLVRGRYWSAKQGRSGKRKHIYAYEQA